MMSIDLASDALLRNYLRNIYHLNKSRTVGKTLSSFIHHGFSILNYFMYVKLKLSWMTT